MADTPIVRAETWLKQHERLIIVALVLALGAFGLNKYFDVSAARADAKNVAAQQIAANDAKNSALLAAQAAQTVAQYQAMVQSLTAENVALRASQTARNTGLGKQVTVDAGLSTIELAKRWDSLAETATTVQGSTVSVSDTDAHKTVALLEQVPVLTANLKDETALAANLQSQVDGAGKVQTIQTIQIAALNKQLTDDAVACKTEVNAVKADARKSKIKWFKIGFVTGFVAGLWGGHAAGL